jgi:alpha-tubulin suppressor-like RCC1 family protein
MARMVARRDADGARGLSWTRRRGRWLLLAVVATLLLAVTGGVAQARVVGGVTQRGVVTEAPAVTQQPVEVTVKEGQPAMFESAATGVPTPTVQWEVSSNGGKTWKAIAGATTDVFTIASAKTAESGEQFRASFKNSAGKASSLGATLTVETAPVVTGQPANVTAEEGQSASFEAAASGFPTPTVQWEASTDGGSTWSAVEGATATRFTIASVTVAQNGSEYRAAFTNPAGEQTSHAAALTIRDIPRLVKQPANTTVEEGENASFEATAAGFPTPTVQWEATSDSGKTWKAIEGATADRLTVPTTTLAENGSEYRALFTNIVGKATSEAATLTVATHHFNVAAWGQNSFGQLGDGGAGEADLPVPVSNLNFVSSLAAGKRHSLAVLADSSVVAWGSNISGQLGNGEEEGGSSDVPEPVPGLSGVKAVAAGEDYSLALLNNGTVMAWGGNESGQLGDGNTAEANLPVPVKGLTGVKAIAAGGEHSLALLTNGTVMAWGDNESGQLGDGKAGNSNVPVALKGLAGVTAIAAGGEHSLALLSDHALMSWGANRFGQLGDGSFSEEEHEENLSNVPVPVSGLNTVTAIAAGSHHSLALLANGTVMAWGEDESGQLGNGSIMRDEELPVAVSELSGVSLVAAGGEHSMALLSNGAVVTWGEDADGELGNGSSGEASDVPVGAVGLGRVVGIAAGGFHDLAYGAPFPTVTSLSPSSGSTAGGTPVTITGTNFAGATAVSFGSTSATSFTVSSETSISAVAPPGTVGFVNVTVTTAAGVSVPVVGDRFTYVAPPTVRKLAPKRGSASGGTSVTITGTGLQGATAVHFGADNASSFVVNSPTTITATAPAGVATVDVTVTTPFATSSVSKNDEFSYAPAVEAVAPNSGPVAGGTLVTVTGVGFIPGTTVTSFKFGKKKATAVECSSSTSCTMLAPAQAAGTVDIIATVGKLKSAANPAGDHFSYS